MIRVLTTKEACELLFLHGLKTDPQKLGLGLQQRVYPFGVAIKDKHWIYEIYENLLMEWIKERETKPSAQENTISHNSGTVME